MSEIQTSDKADNIRKSLLSTSWVKIPQTIFGIYGVRRIDGEANDLVHGEWSKWCEGIGMDRSNANN